MIIAGLLALLLGGVSADGWLPRLETTTAMVLQAPGRAPADAVEGAFKWEEDLRWFTFRLLKDLRRYGIRLSRLIQRSAQYWIAWLWKGTALLLFGALASSVDRRLFALARERGMRVAVIYASVGIVVFLRLLRDRRISGRARGLVLLAVVYGICAGYWLDLRWRILDLADQLLVMAAAARWFVWRCPDEIVEQHAAHVRERILANRVVSSGQRQ
jgi:hypothetical protein